MQSNRMIGEKQYEMGRPLGTDEWRQTNKKSRGGKKHAGKGEGHKKDRPSPAHYHLETIRKEEIYKYIYMCVCVKFVEKPL